MTISNPVTKWLDGSIKEHFTYEGGSTLYHFCPADCGIRPNVMKCNVIFFANNLAHAYDVLRRMFEFILSQTYESHYFMYDQEYVKLVLANWDKVRIVEAPTNQFYIVGWASNDTVV